MTSPVQQFEQRSEAPRDPVLREQLSYYASRASEYDQWWNRQGRYDRGVEDNAQWFRDVTELDAALAVFQPTGRILELACGTGIWSEKLLPHAERLTMVDGSSEMLAINAARLRSPRVDYIQADLFSWEPTRQFDVVFFGFWLSHVPPELFDAFWLLVRRCLAPGGRCFFVDSRREVTSTATDHRLPDRESIRSLRRLNDGREFHVYKIFYDASQLQTRLENLGWECEVKETAKYFIRGIGSARHS